MAPKPELWLQVGQQRVACVRDLDGAREICDAYNNPKHIRRDGVQAAWLVDPETTQVIHGAPPPEWKTFEALS